MCFFLTWHYPNRYDRAGKPLGNHYATLWPDARAVAREIAHDFAPLRARTERFRKTFYDSTLPYWLLDCVSSQVSTIRHAGVVFRIANGDTYGWEGSNGCCPPTCTHVWGYEQALARLFPDLERDMRRIDFLHQQGPGGGINNRTEVLRRRAPPASAPSATATPPRPQGVPRGPEPARRRLAARVLAARQGGGQYLLARDAAASGGQPDGTLSDEQWNTYDNAVHGVNSFIGTYYLAALRAGEEMARRVGDDEAARRYRAVFEKGREKLVALCWNGEYYEQHLPGYQGRSGEYGPGCLSDQLIGQWWAHWAGARVPAAARTGPLRPARDLPAQLADRLHRFPAPLAQVRGRGRQGPAQLHLAAGRAARGHDPVRGRGVDRRGVPGGRAPALRGDGGRGAGDRQGRARALRWRAAPADPAQPLERDRVRRALRPRALSSWSLLLALSGFAYDGPNGVLRFAPRHTPEDFKAFFSAPEGWGSLRQTRRGKTQRNEVKVEAGRVLVAPAPGCAPGRDIEADTGRGEWQTRSRSGPGYRKRDAHRFVRSRFPPRGRDVGRLYRVECNTRRDAYAGIP